MQEQDDETFTEILGALDLLSSGNIRVCFGIVVYSILRAFIYIYIYITSYHLSNPYNIISAMLSPTLILQFIAMMKKMPDSENELKEAFTAFDADGDGMFLLYCLNICT